MTKLQIKMQSYNWYGDRCSEGHMCGPVGLM